MLRNERCIRFRDRQEAGEILAERLAQIPMHDPIVLALPRGGVAVGLPIAQALGAPLDVLVVRKIGAPHHPEFGVGAIAPGGVRVLDEQVVNLLGIPQELLEELIDRETAELERRLRRYRGARPLPAVRNRTVILVDDGLATGVTARAAIEALRRWGAGSIVLAVPVCAAETADALRPRVDELVCGATPLDFQAVGMWYADFEQMSDEQVLELLERAKSSAQA